MDMQNPTTLVDPITGEEAFAVEPKTDCPHALELDLSIINMVQNQGQQLFNMPCEDCSNRGENWICLQCQKIFCSRYVKGHMAAHNSNNLTHHIALSFADLSFWCYSCDSYITNANLRNIRREFQIAKFNEKPYLSIKPSQISKEEVEQQKNKAISAKGFFIPGDITESKVFNTLVLSKFPKDLNPPQKGVLKGYEVQDKQKRKQLVQKEGSETVGSVVLFSEKVNELSREQVVYMLTEIEAFPEHSSMKLASVEVSGLPISDLIIFYV